jgi:hypothetical protein
VGLFAYRLDGELSGASFPLVDHLDFGTAASPDRLERVYVQSDNQEESFLAAVDKRTGRSSGRWLAEWARA